MKNSSEKTPGWLSPRKNLQAFREASQEVRKLSAEMAEVSEDRSSRKRKVADRISLARTRQRLALLKALAFGGGSAVAALTPAVAIHYAGQQNDAGQQNADENHGVLHGQEAGSFLPQAAVKGSGGLPEDRFKPLSVTPIEPAPISDTPDVRDDAVFENQIALQEYWKRISLEAMGLFVDADPEVAKLIEFLEHHAFASIPVGVRETLRMARGMDDLNLQNPNAFELVFMPEHLARSMPSSIMAEPGGRTIRIATTFQVKEWLGIMLLHELVHVWDQRVGGEKAWNRDEYLAGEVRAHRLEMKLLKAWDPERYAELIKRGIPLFRKKDRQGLFALFESLYPFGSAVSQNEDALGTASCLMAIAFEEALARGVDERGLVATYQLMVRNFGNRPAGR